MHYAIVEDRTEDQEYLLGLIREEKDIWLSPAIGKVIGKYPEEFLENGGSDEQ